MEFRITLFAALLSISSLGFAQDDTCKCTMSDQKTLLKFWKEQKSYLQNEDSINVIENISIEKFADKKLTKSEAQKIIDEELTELAVSRRRTIERVRLMSKLMYEHEKAEIKDNGLITTEEKEKKYLI